MIQFSTITVKNKNDFLICQRVWKTVKSPGKIREMSGNFEVDDKWQHASRSFYFHSIDRHRIFIHLSYNEMYHKTIV